MLYVKDPYGVGYMNSAFKLCQDNNIALKVASFNYGDAASMNIGMAQIKALKLKAIVVILFGADVTNFLTAARTEGMYGPEYHYIFTDSTGGSSFTGVTNRLS